MMLKLQKKLAAAVLHCSPKRVVFDPARLEDIKEAITKNDIRLLIGEGVIRKTPAKGVSRTRANKRLIQRRKGLRKGLGSRKGKFTARLARKKAWMNKIRAQREFIKKIKPSLKQGAFKELYLKSKGGFFRSVKHIKLYVEEHELFAAPLKKQTSKGDVSEIKTPKRNDKKIKNKADAFGIKKTTRVQDKNEI